MLGLTQRLLFFLALIGLARSQAIEFPANGMGAEEEPAIVAPNATANEIAVYINTRFLGNQAEPMANLLESLIQELDETVLKSGTMFAKVYNDETPKFTKG